MIERASVASLGQGGSPPPASRMYDQAACRARTDLRCSRHGAYPSCRWRSFSMSLLVPNSVQCKRQGVDFGATCPKTRARRDADATTYTKHSSVRVPRLRSPLAGVRSVRTPKQVFIETPVHSFSHRSHYTQAK